MSTEDRIVQLFVDLAQLRERTYARLVAEHGPERAAEMWQAAIDAHSARAAGAERRRSTRDAVPACSAPAAGAEGGSVPGLHSPRAAGAAPVAPTAREAARYPVRRGYES